MQENPPSSCSHMATHLEERAVSRCRFLSEYAFVRAATSLSAVVHQVNPWYKMFVCCSSVTVFFKKVIALRMKEGKNARL